MTKTRSILLVLAASFFLYAALLWGKGRPSFFLPLTVLGLSFSLLAWSYCRSPWSAWLYVIPLFTPLEISSAFSFLPALSPIDYFCAAAACALGLRMRPREWPAMVLKIFGESGIFCWGAFFLLSLTNALWQGGSIRGLLRWGEFLFGCFVASLAVLQDPEDLDRRAAVVLQCAGFLTALLALKQFLTLGGAYQTVQGPFFQHNALGAYLMLCLPASAGLWMTRSGWQTIWNIAATGVIAAALVLCYSRGAWLGGLAGTFVFLYVRRKPAHFVVLGLAVAGLLLIVRGTSPRLLHESARPFYWQAGKRILSKHPLVGLGPGNYGVHLKDYLDGQALKLYADDLRVTRDRPFWFHLHNLYLQMAVECGLPAFFLWAAGLFLLVAPAFRACSPARCGPASLKPYFIISITAFLVHNVVDILFVNSFDMVFAILLALCRFSGAPAENRS